MLLNIAIPAVYEINFIAVAHAGSYFTVAVHSQIKSVKYEVCNDWCQMRRGFLFWFECIGW